MSVWSKVLILLLLACADATYWPAVPMMRPGVPPGAGSAPDFSDPADDIPKSRDEALAMVRKYVPSEDAPENYNLVPNPPKVQETKPVPEVQEKKIKKVPEEVEVTNPNMFHNLEKYLEKNDNTPEAKMRPPPLLDVSPPRPPPRSSAVNEDDSPFEHHKFTLKNRRKLKSRNLTHCIENKPRTFQPAVIVDITWIPFYDWSLASSTVTVVVFQFLYVPVRIVKEYLDLYKNHVTEAIKWDQPKLLVKEIGPTEAYSIEYLFIAVDRKGLFHALRKFEKPESMNNSDVVIPIPTVLLKIEDPYLLVMFCEVQKIVLLAQDGYIPETDKEKEAEAATIQLIGIEQKGNSVRRDKELEKQIIEEEIKANKEKAARKYLSVHPEKALPLTENEKGMVSLGFPDRFL